MTEASYGYARAGAEHAEGLLALFESAGSGCFCQYWHFAGDKNAWLERCYVKPEDNRAGLVQQLAGSELCGVVALDAARRVCGWMKVTRAASLPRLYEQRVYRNLPCFQSGGADTTATNRERVYTVACCFVAEADRGRGVARGLLARAIAVAREVQATALEAFPRAKPEGEPLRTDEVWMGPLTLFEAAGFQAVSDFRPYPVLRLHLP